MMNRLIIKRLPIFIFFEVLNIPMPIRVFVCGCWCWCWCICVCYLWCSVFFLVNVVDVIINDVIFIVSIHTVETIIVAFCILVAAFAAFLNFYASQQLLRLLVRQLTQNPHRVFTLNFVTRMHKAVRQLAAGGKNQQARSVDIESPDGHPFAGFNARQIIKNGNAIARIISGDDLAFGLVIKQHARHVFGKFELYMTLIDQHVVARRNLRAGGGDDAVHHHATG